MDTRFTVELYAHAVRRSPFFCCTRRLYIVVPSFVFVTYMIDNRCKSLFRSSSSNHM